MKKILLVGVQYLYYTNAFIEGLKNAEDDICIDSVNLPCFNRDKLSLKEYLRYKLNKKRYQEKYYVCKVSEIRKMLQTTHYDEFYSISGNIFYEYIDRDLLKWMKAKGIKTKAIYLSTVKRFNEKEQNFDLFDKIYSFEPSDVQYMKEKHINNTFYMPIGAADSIYASDHCETKKKYDVCFVGMYNEYRAYLCEKVAKFCIENNINFVVYGGYWKNRKILNIFESKKHEREFSKKYPYLSRCIINKILPGKEVAALYKQSKICLNIHIPVHLGLNDRVFEISASPNFQLCDEREDFAKLGFTDGENIAIYKDADDCIEKIKYYLANDELREQIAKRSNELVLKKYTINKLIAKTLNDDYRGEF